MYKICLVEDELDLSNLIKLYLEKENYEVVQYTKGSEAILNISDDINLWILDIMLADEISGYEVLKKIKEYNADIPVIFTSARDKDIDKIIGLELGSDDYLAKPFSTKELVLRVNNLIKRIYKDKNSDHINYDIYKIDLSKRVVFENDKEIKLTTLEFDLLNIFITNLGKVYSRDELLTLVWGEDYYGSDRATDDLVRRLRKKMPKLNINTVYGYGYRLS